MTEILTNQLAEILATAAMPVAVYLAALVRRTNINTTVVRAIARGAGAAYMSLLEDKQGAAPAAVERAVDAGAAYVEQRIPTTLGKAGFASTDAVRSAVRAQLGTLLAGDPNVKVSG